MLPAVSYELWSASCDTLHAHTQVLGKLTAALAPAEPAFGHVALRLTARGWETPLLRAPDGSGGFVVALDLRKHQAVAEHSGGGRRQISLTPERSVGEVTKELLSAVSELVGVLEIDPTPQEVPWSVPLDQDHEHAHYAVDEIERYFEAASQVALTLTAFRAPYRGRATPVNAWWGSFDLAVSLFSSARAGLDAAPGASAPMEFAVGWWPGDPRYPRAAFYAYLSPAMDGFAAGQASPQGRWVSELGEYVLDWDQIRATADPSGEVLEFARSTFRHACEVSGWDPALASSADGRAPAS